jgi:FixJ family two-component response regulator
MRLATLLRTRWNLRRILGQILASEPQAAIPVIAIIDDDASVRAAIGSLVRSLGYVAQSYASAELFLLSGDLLQIDCIVTDVQMPAGMSGLDLQERLSGAGIKVPTVFVTAFPEDHIRSRAEAAGAIGFLAKPFDGHTLVKLLVGAVEA